MCVLRSVSVGGREQSRRFLGDDGHDDGLHQATRGRYHELEHPTELGTHRQRSRAGECRDDSHTAPQETRQACRRQRYDDYYQFL